jgi:hypothetical protein
MDINDIQVDSITGGGAFFMVNSWIAQRADQKYTNNGHIYNVVASNSPDGTFLEIFGSGNPPSRLDVTNATVSHFNTMESGAVANLYGKATLTMRK